MPDKKLNVGDLVKILRPVPDEPADGIGYVYEEYNKGTSRPGVSIITQNGRDLGGYSFQEQQMFLEFIKPSGFDYEFFSVTKLADDFRRGIFKPVFDSIAPVNS